MSTNHAVAEEREWRANTYQLLATLFQSPPNANLLKSLREISPNEAEGNGQPIANAWIHLSGTANNIEPIAVRKEYHELFIGMNRGEILPYASWYLTGFLMEKPLAKIREDLFKMGIERRENVHEPEDHIAALFEVMVLLIQAGDVRQNDFFEQHIFNWTPRLFNDIRNARSAVFYSSVAILAAEFIQLEKQLIDLTKDL